MPLTKASRDVAFINTSPIDERVILVKPETELQKLSDNSTDLNAATLSEDIQSVQNSSKICA